MRSIQVSIPRSPLGTLTYSVPEEFPSIEPGMRVLVPISSRFVTGFVTATQASVEGLNIRPIADLLDPENLFSPALLSVTKWMADYYLAEWADILKSALPPGLDVRPETLVSITDSGRTRAEEHPLLEILNSRSRLPLKEIYKLFGHRGTFSQLRGLQDRGLIEMIAGKKIKRRGTNTVEVVQNSEPPSNEKERMIYEYIKSKSEPVPVEAVRSAFPGSAAILRRMDLHGLVRRFWLPVSAPVFWPQIELVDQPNEAQRKALDEILSRLNSFAVLLLHGVTGSGKTEVYLRAAKQVIAQNKSVLILVPEIALLPLIVRRAERYLHTTISVLHSELGDRERHEEWQKAHRGESQLVIGTRSALFAPLRNLGLIVIDEEHDGSYKQGEYPRYHARESAIIRAQHEQCPILLGSATPSLESYYNAGNGKFLYLSLPARVEERPMPEVRLVDMKEDYRQTGDPVFSRLLLDQMGKTLERKKQILILQNRRGYAAWLMCRECGNLLECPNCSMTLTYHKQPNRMICHYCEYSRLTPSKCEKCASRYLHLFGVGTEKITESLKNIFPNAKIERFDRDSTRQTGSIARILTRFALQEIDILVGTQMLAKGHDFPAVTLVGVIGADSGIGIPDFRASERLFQLITQVSGRSGRGNDTGLVIPQTFHPDHYALKSALDHHYQSFYEKEIRFRRAMQFPPIVSMANVIVSGRDEKKTLEEARSFAKFMLACKNETMKLIGPAIAPMARLKTFYRFQILLKSPTRKGIRECLTSAIQHSRKSAAGKSRITMDMDPYSLA